MVLPGPLASTRRGPILLTLQVVLITSSSNGALGRVGKCMLATVAARSAGWEGNNSLLEAFVAHLMHDL